MKISFQQAQLSDIPFLLSLRKKTMNEYLQAAGILTSDEYHLARIKEYFADSLIIQVNNKGVGLIKLSKQSDKLHIRQFQILPLLQNKGIGSNVLTLIIQKAKAIKLPVTLNVILSNPAKKFYERHGFTVTGRNDLEYQMKYQH